jgi:TonB-dependent Receptor Plug Domain
MYSVVGLIPGRYRITINKPGFREVFVDGLVLNVQDVVAQNVQLQIGSISESVTVTADTLSLNTTDGSVGTVVDRKYLENMPLNGRSFQDLILLTPGVVTNTPQSGASTGNSGEFNVNGQRTESNYYTVDGVSANTGIYPDPSGPGNSGSLPASTALGTTQPLVSVDALQEFRVQSSTYSAEYGRNPGGQFSFVTRSGTNQWHGTAFEYLRNSYFDANNWFNNYFGQPEPSLRQNDFGGTLGGPLDVPHLYDGRDKTFFFFSYEGLRLVQPQAANISFVPDAGLRASAPAPLRQVMNAFPLPSPGAPDLGNGLGEFIAAWSNPSSINAYSFRLDHNFGDRLRVFFRFSDTPSSVVSRQTNTSVTGGVPSMLGAFEYLSRTYTFGATSVVSSRLTNEFRLNYSSNLSTLSYRLDDFGGAQPASLAGISKIDSANAYTVSVGLSFGNYGSSLQEGYSSGKQSQWNVVDSLSLSEGRHHLKFGVDYRRSAPVQQVSNPAVYYSFMGASDVQTNNPGFAFPIASVNGYPLIANFSAFAQDEWRIDARLNLSMGLRWDVNPAPSVTHGLMPYTIRGASDFSTMTLAPEGTSLWKTTWYNFGPRLGAAYTLRNAAGHETILRGGGGLFFDSGQQTGLLGYLGPGLSNSQFLGYEFGSPVAFPIPPSQLPTVTPPTPPYGTVFAYPPHLQLPYTLQWNVAIEQALGKSQTVSTTYVGSHAGRLLEWNQVQVAPFNPDFTSVIFLENGHTADYNALQLQYRRQLSAGLSVLAMYTFSHSIDYGSSDSAFPYIRGNSDFDVRHNFSAAFSYDVPNVLDGRYGSDLLHHWGVDGRLTLRTAFPVTLDGPLVIDPATGQRAYRGLDLVPGQPIYLYGANCTAILQGLGDLAPGQGCPGNKAVNPNAFANPAGNAFGDAPRNFVRGFGAWQMDLAIRREFPLYERLKLQFRAEAFNLFNHPNFGYVNPFFGTSLFGQATSTLNQSLGTMSAIYQMGGPRSLQFGLKLIF